MPGLPDLNEEITHGKRLCAAANKVIEETVAETVLSCIKCYGKALIKTKEENYQFYDGELRCEMVQYANEHGVLAASRHFTSLLGHDVPYTSSQSTINSTENLWNYSMQ